VYSDVVSACVYVRRECDQASVTKRLRRRKFSLEKTSAVLCVDGPLFYSCRLACGEALVPLIPPMMSCRGSEDKMSSRKMTPAMFPEMVVSHEVMDTEGWVASEEMRIGVMRTLWTFHLPF